MNHDESNRTIQLQRSNECVTRSAQSTYDRSTMAAAGSATVAAEDGDDVAHQSVSQPILSHINGDCDGQENGSVHADEISGGNERQGTVMSARLNILSTMVGGGSLSLPMAFHKSGNAFMGPLFIILVAASAEFCFRILIASDAILTSTPSNTTKKGTGSFESVASAAFGPKALVFSMALVTAMCFFGTVGYAVLLRDMLEPIADAVSPPPEGTTGVTLSHNVSMLCVILAVTPLCTLRNFTALRRFGAASMMSVLILGACVVYRSLQCNFSPRQSSQRHSSWFDYLTYFPHSLKDILDALPLFVSCFVCHYNILPVHNELRNPSQQRVNWWVRSTTWFAASFYLVIGFAGSMYGNCTSTGDVKGNILLDFDEDDPLLFMGRMCLALTITLAFPMLVIPARDILIRALKRLHSGLNTTASQVEIASVYSDAQSELRGPLLAEENGDDGGVANEDEVDTPVSFIRRLAAAVFVFWSGAAVACCVTSIDVVWDLLGSSLSILLSYLVPCGSYIALTRKQLSILNNENADSSVDPGWRTSIAIYVCWFLVLLFTPLMFVLTANAVNSTFFQ